VIRFASAAALLLFGASPSFAALSPPKLDVEATCRRANLSAGGQQSSYDNCLRAELAAQKELAKKWSTFKPGPQATCMEGTKIGGAPSYVQLITCLELDKQAVEAAIENRKGLKMPSPQPAPSRGAPPSKKQ
jgi:hypothetical protein